MFLGFSVGSGKTDSMSEFNSAANRTIVRSQVGHEWAQCAFSNSRAEAAGRATSTTTRMSGSTLLMASSNLRLVISDFAPGRVSLFSYRARFLTCGPA